MLTDERSATICPPLTLRRQTSDLQNPRNLITESKIQTLALKLATESYFGPKVMGRCTVMGCTQCKRRLMCDGNWFGPTDLWCPGNKSDQRWWNVSQSLPYSQWESTVARGTCRTYKAKQFQKAEKGSVIVVENIENYKGLTDPQVYQRLDRDGRELAHAI